MIRKAQMKTADGTHRLPLSSFIRWLCVRSLSFGFAHQNGLVAIEPYIAVSF